jgi:predicted metal-dependent hydrolase
MKHRLLRSVVVPAPDAPFAYRLRESARARCVGLRVTLEHGLEVVLPRGCDPAVVPDVLRRKQRWIRAALDHVAAHLKLFGSPQPWRLPSQIELPAIGRIWRVEAVETASRRVMVREIGVDCLQITGRVGHEKACRTALARWLLEQAREHLPPRLRVVSDRIGLHCQRVTVRRQRSRWGSCSRRKTISLNAKLLFLPPTLADYVLVHELCHLAEMNHSGRFWTLVAAHHPNHRQASRELREIWKHLPRWAA